MAQIRMLDLNNYNMNALLHLLDQLGYPQKINEFEPRLKNFVQSPGYGVALAYQDEKIIGMVAWSKSIALIYNKTRMRIEGLVVDLEYRNKGIGKMLMQFVEEHAQQFSPCIIELTSGARRSKDGTHEFYNAIGYVNSGDMAKLYFRKEI